jgi:hypothetical protein
MFARRCEEKSSIALLSEANKNVMRVVESSGTPQQIGETTGEALAGDIRQHLGQFPMRQWPAFEARLPDFVATLERHLPNVLQEIRGLARGAGVEDREILRLNLPLYANDLDQAGQPALEVEESPGDGCTNFVFGDGPDGPVWGKNNDGCRPHRPVVLRHVRPQHGLPQAVFTFAGMVATTDGMNAEGVAVGHSSVGSVFQQSDHYPPIRLWAYAAMSRARSTADFVRAMGERPLRGKGYSAVCVDAKGAAVAIDAPCPLFQARPPAAGAAGLHGVNCYQHPALLVADRRPAAGKVDAHARWHLLDRALAAGSGPPPEIDTSAGCGDLGQVPLPGAAGYDVGFARALLHHHGDTPLCRHGAPLDYHSEYSMIGLPASRRLLFCGLHPCQQTYGELVVA